MRNNFLRIFLMKMFNGLLHSDFNVILLAGRRALSVIYNQQQQKCNGLIWKRILFAHFYTDFWSGLRGSYRQTAPILSPRVVSHRL